MRYPGQLLRDLPHQVAINLVKHRIVGEFDENRGPDRVLARGIGPPAARLAREEDAYHLRQLHRGVLGCRVASAGRGHWRFVDGRRGLKWCDRRHHLRPYQRLEGKPNDLDIHPADEKVRGL